MGQNFFLKQFYALPTVIKPKLVYNLHFLNLSYFLIDLMPPKLADEPKLATDLLPPEVKNGPVVEWMPSEKHQPEIPEEYKEKSIDNNNDLNKKKVPAMLFVINVIAVKNSTAEDSNDVLHNDVIDQVPSEIAGINF